MLGLFSSFPLILLLLDVTVLWLYIWKPGYWLYNLFSLFLMTENVFSLHLVVLLPSMSLIAFCYFTHCSFHNVLLLSHFQDYHFLPPQQNLTLLLLVAPPSPLLFVPHVFPMPHNKRIASCDTAHVPAQWMKLSWFPWGSEKGWHSHTYTRTSFHIQIATAPPSRSYIQSWARLSQGHPTRFLARTLDSHSDHTEAALFSPHDWKRSRWLHLKQASGALCLIFKDFFISCCLTV